MSDLLNFHEVELIPFRLQYDQYKAAVAPTQSSPAVVNQKPPQGQGVVPIGVPVDIKKEQPADADTTTLAYAQGQAEPGRDIFGDHPHNDMKSEGQAIPHREEEPLQDTDEKAISTMNVDTTTEAPKEAEPAESITESSSSSIASTSSEEATTALDLATEATPAHDHAEGPKPEEEAEADRARAALFPDEQEK